MIDLLGLGALALVSVECALLGWLSGIDFPRGAAWSDSALRVLVGSCLVAVAQLALAGVGVGFGSVPIVLLLAAGFAVALRLLRLRETSAPDKETPTGGRERVGWLVLGGVFVVALARSFIVPEAGWDAYSHWGLRAQAFATAQTIVNAHSEHEYYPPLVPLLEAWLHLHRGVVSIDLAKTVWAVIGSAFAVCLGWHFRLTLRATWLAPYLAAGVLLATTALVDGFWTGQADLPLTAFLTLATLATWRWLQTRERAWLVQAGLFASATALTKFEGLPRIGVLVLAVALVAASGRDRTAWRPIVLLAVSAGLAALVWTSVAAQRGIAPNSEHIGALQPMAIGSVLLALLAVFGGLRTGGAVLVAILAWAVLGRKLLSEDMLLLSFVVVGQLVATLVGFLLSATSPDLEVRTSATRLFEQFLPLALFVGAVGLLRTLHL